MKTKARLWWIFAVIMALLAASFACSSESSELEKAETVPAQAEAQEEEAQVDSKTAEPEISATSVPPTETPIPPTPTPAPLGMSRANPFPMTELVNAQNWDIQVLEAIRGDEAWQLIKAANQFNEPPLEGMEYLLVRISAKCTYADSDSHSIGEYDFDVTGDKLIKYSPASVVVPEPSLDAELFSGGETEGWVAFSVGIGEGNLIIIFDEMMSFDDDRFRFIALEEGASVSVDIELAEIQPADTGLTRENPIPIGESGITEDWIVTIRAVIRGEEAWAMTQEANMFNEPPADGMEYVAIKVHAQCISTVDEVVSIDGYSFDTTGDNNILYDDPSVVDPIPPFEAYLYPGGEYEGWIIKEVAIGETSILALFEPTFSFDTDENRYFALEDGASISVPPDVNNIAPNDVGIDRTSAAALGEVVITEDWEVRVLETVRGQDAWTLIQEANQFNDPPEPGMEYVLLKVWVRNINPQDEALSISEYYFEITGDLNVVYENPSVVDPDPMLDLSLYPTGEGEGWVTLQVAEGETGLILEFNPEFLGGKRFLSLE
jgi:hypothetical protein